MKLIRILWAVMAAGSAISASHAATVDLSLATTVAGGELLSGANGSTQIMNWVPQSSTSSLIRANITSGDTLTSTLTFDKPLTASDIEGDSQLGMHFLGVFSLPNGAVATKLPALPSINVPGSIDLYLGDQLVTSFATNASISQMVISNFTSLVATSPGEPVTFDRVVSNVSISGIDGVGGIVAANFETITPTAVPEPSAMMLMGLGLVFGGVALRRRT